MAIALPTQDQLSLFIQESCSLAGFECSVMEVEQTYRKNIMHPLAAGHINCVQMTLKMAQQSTFPTKHGFDFSSVEQSDKSLFWVKELHRNLMSPMVKYASSYPKLEPYKPLLGDCGSYRIREKANMSFVTGKPKPLPPVIQIQRLMHWWYSDLCQFHLKNMSVFNLGSPSIDQLKMISTFAHDKHLQFLCIQPFLDGNGRIGRFIENALRLRWGLSWKTIKKSQAQEYVGSITNYEDKIWMPIYLELLPTLSSPQYAKK